MFRPFDGSLFAEGFLREAITELPDWADMSASALDDLEAALQARFDRFPTDQSPNESQTEEDLIWPVLKRLGWTAHLRQQNLSPSAARTFRMACCSRTVPTVSPTSGGATGTVWPSSSPSGGCGPSMVVRGEESAPSTQMLRYLRRADDVTTGRVR